MPIDSSSIEIEEDMGFQRRSWIVERVCWILMAVVVVAAVLGLFAEGPLSWTTVGDSRSHIVVEYGRIQRQSAPTTIRVLVAADAIKPDGITIEVDEAFTNALQITTIRPQPVQSMAVANGMRFRFEADARAATALYLYVRPEEVGSSRLRLGLADEAPVELPMFTYP